MRRRVFLTVVALLVAVVMTVSAGAQKEGAAASQVTLNVLHYVNATEAGYADDQAIWAKFIADNPDIKIVKEELFDEPFHQKVAAYVAAGTMPDVMFMWPSGRSTAIHEKKLVKDLTPLLGKDFLANFVPAAVDPNNQNSKFLAELPQSVTYTTVMYANTKLLKDNGLTAPKTYAELKAMVAPLKAKGIQTVLMANKDQWPMQSCLFSTVVGRMLGDAWVDSVIAGQAKFTDPGFVGALSVIDTLYKDGVISRDTIQIGYGDAPALFADNKAAFLIDGDWRQGAFLTDKTSGVALIPPARQASDFAFMNIPVIPGEKNPGVVSAIVGVGWGISSAIPAGSAKEKAAVRLVQYLYSPEVQKIRLETGAFIPTRKGITSDKIEPFTSMMPQYYASIIKTVYVLDGVLAVDVYTPLNQGLQEMGLGTKTPAQVAAEVQKAFDEWKMKK